MPFSAARIRQISTVGTTRQAGLFTLNVKGLEEAAKSIDPAIVGPPLRRFFTKGTDLQYKGVTRRIRKRTREAANSVRKEVDPRRVPLWGRVYSNLFRIRFLEYGTKKHRVPVDAEFKAWAQRRKRNPWAVAKSIEAKGTKGVRMFSKTKRGTRRKIFAMVKDVKREIANQV